MRAWSWIGKTAAAVAFLGVCHVAGCAAREAGEPARDEPVGEAEGAVCTCARGFTCCPSGGFPDIPICVNEQTNPNHCGSCSTVCTSQAHTVPTCSGGACTVGTTCVAPFLDCDDNSGNGCEVDPTTDRNHCGGCNTACSSDKICSGGACVCPAGTQLDSSGVCAKTCSTDRDCLGNPAGDLCINGLCQTGPVSCGSGSVMGDPCASGAGTCCGTTTLTCVDTRWDPHNCGGCNNPIHCSSQETCCYFSSTDHSAVVGSNAGQSAAQHCANLGGTNVGCL